MLARFRSGFARIIEFAFGPAAANRFPRAQRLFLSGMLLLGGGLWLAFFSTSVPERFFHAIDWGIEWQYYEVIQEAYQTHQIPYHVSEPIQPIQPTQRFLAIPESLYPLAPQAPLLALMTVKHFAIVNVLLHFLAGFWGCLLLRKRFDLSPFVFAVLFLLFNFNGHILAHVAAGHKWNGYFYLPLLAAFVFDAAQRSAPVFETAVKIAVVNLFILLQGTLHPYAMSLIFLGLLCLCHREARWTALLGIALTALLSLFRLLPAAMTTRRLRPEDFADGYRSLSAFVQSIISVHLYPRAAFPWEYDLYVSVVGLAFVLVCGVGLRYSRRPELATARFQGFGLPLLILTIFAFRDYWLQVIYWLPDLVHLADKIPNTERIPSRFMVIPLVFLLVIACARLQKLHAFFTQRLWRAAAAGLGLLALAGSLGRHWRHWRIDAIEHDFRSLADNIPDPHIIRLADPGYLRMVHSSFVFSLSVLVALLAVWAWRARRRRGQAAPAAAVAPPAGGRRALPVGAIVAGLLVLALVANEGRRRLSSEGLWVTYYRGTQLHHARWRGVETNICRTFFEDPPVWWLGRKGFSSRWTGVLEVPQETDYIFQCQSSDGVRFYLDGLCVIDSWRDQTWAESARGTKLHLTQGPHPLMLEHYSRQSDDGGVRVRWCGGGIPPDTVLGAPYLRKGR